MLGVKFLLAHHPVTFCSKQFGFKLNCKYKLLLYYPIVGVWLMGIMDYSVCVCTKKKVEMR